MQDKVATLALVITRYPDRLYHFLRKAFTLAALQGHDVTHRVTQAEVLSIVWPILLEYFTRLSKGEQPPVAVTDGEASPARVASNTTSQPASAATGPAAASATPNTSVAGSIATGNDSLVQSLMSNDSAGGTTTMDSTTEPEFQEGLFARLTSRVMTATNRDVSLRVCLSAVLNRGLTLVGR